MNLYADEAKVQLGAADLNDQIKKAMGDTTLADQKSSAEKEGESGGKESKSSEANFMNRKVRQSARTNESGTGVGAGMNSVVQSLLKVFTDAWENLKYIGSRLEELVVMLVSAKITIAEFFLELLKAVGAVVIDTAQNVANVVFDLFDKVIEVVRTVLNQNFKVPVISSLLEKFLGVKIKFSMLDVIAFIGAVPVTVIYKLVTNRAPHQDLSASALSDALNAASPNSNSAPISSRSVPRALLSDEKGGSDISQPREIVSRSTTAKTTGGVFGVIGGSIGIIRSITLSLKFSMKDKAPDALKYMDVGLAFFMAACALGRLGTMEYTIARNLAFFLVTGALFVFAFSLYEVKHQEELDTKGWPGNVFLTVFGFMALIRFTFYVAPYKDTNIVVISLLGALNWFLAAPHHLLKDIDGPYYLFMANARGAFVLCLSILLIDDSAQGIKVIEPV